jgi:predicted PurR-regulated permease PerM
MATSQNLETRTIVRIVVIVILSAFALVLAWLLREPLAWVFLAAFVAASLSGPVNYLNRFMKRLFAIALVFLALLLIPVAIAAIILPPVVDGAVSLVDHAPEYASDLQEYVTESPQLSGLEEKYQISEKIQERADRLPEAIGSAAGALSSFGSSLVSSLAAICTILVMAFLMLMRGAHWVDWLIRQQPKAHQARIRKVVTQSNRAIGNYLAGNAAISIFAGLTAYIVMRLLDIPFAAPLAVTVALLDLIPMIGSLIAGVAVGLVSLFVDFPTVTIIWAIWMIAYQQLENNLIQPQIQRRSVGINSLVVIVAVLFGSQLFGIIGALLAIPLAAAVQIVIKEWWDYKHPPQRSLRKARAKA